MIKGLLNSRVFLIFGLLLVGFLSWSLYGIKKSVDQAKDQFVVAEGRLESLKAQSSNIDGLSARGKDEDYLLQQARLRLGVMKPGEKAALFFDKGEVEINDGVELQKNTETHQKKFIPRIKAWAKFTVNGN